MAGGHDDDFATLAPPALAGRPTDRNQQQQQQQQQQKTGFAVAILHNNNESVSSHYDIFSTSSSLGKTKAIAPPSSGDSSSSGPSMMKSGQATGCAFYDAECRRQQQQQQQQQQLGTKQSSNYANNNLLLSVSSTTPSSVLSLSLAPNYNWNQRQPMMINNNEIRPQWLTTSGGYGTGPILMRQPGAKISPLAQPLPPWGDDENHALFISPSIANADISRIKLPQFANSGSSNFVLLNGGGRQTNSKQSGVFLSPSVNQAQHLQSIKSTQSALLPSSGLQGRLVQLTTPPTPAIRSFGNGSQTANQFNLNRSQQQQQQSTTYSPPPFRPSNYTPTVFAGQRITPLVPISMNANANFFSPIIMRQQQQQQVVARPEFTAGSVTSNVKEPQSQSGSSSSAANYIPSIFQSSNHHQQDQLSETTKDQPALLLQQQQQQPVKQRAPIQVISSNFPRPPSSHRKQRLQQVQIDNNGSLGANFDLNPSNGAKQARKLVQLQQTGSSGGSLPAGARLYFQSTSSGNNQPDSILAATSGDSSTVMAGKIPQQQQQQLSTTNLPSRLTPAQQLVKLRQQQQQQLDNSQQPVNSQQQQQVRANLVRSTSNGEYFQNRTISDIMDDSGLRLDGQMVTFNKLKECLVQSRLLSLIMQSTNPITIFMPTDQAFQRLVQHQQMTMSASASNQATVLNNNLQQQQSFIPMKKLEQSDIANDRFSLDCSSTQAQQLLLDHLSVKLMTPKELTHDIIIPSMSNRNLILSSIPDKKIVVIDGQPVVAATRAKNGMVYVVNKFLNITNQLGSVVELINQQKNLSTFSSYLRFSGIEPQLRRDTGPITILAPTNDAFDQLSSKARAVLNSDPAALLDIMKGHIVDGAQFGKLISMRVQLRTLNSDQTIDAKNIRPNVYLLDNQMTSIRLVGSSGNGVVNSIDRIIVPRWLRQSFKSNNESFETPPAGFTGGFTGDREIESTSNFVRSGRFDDSQGLALDRINQPIIRLPTTTSTTDISITSSDGFNNNNNSVGGPFGGDTSTALSSGGGASLSDVDVFVRPTNEVDNNLFFSTNASSSSSSSSASNVIDNGNRFGFGNNSFLNDNSSTTTRNMRLIEKLASMMQANRFVKLLHKANSERLLKQSATNYVILVPTDQAIDKLPKQIIQMLEKNNQKLEDLVNYHILETTFEYINMIPDGQTLNTINDKDIVFNWYRNNTILTASGSVILGGVQEDNIALLIVDRVLYPTPGDIMDIISKSPILSNLTRMVRNTGLEQQLSKSGPFTLFAPSDFAFNQMSSNDIEFLNRNRDAARRFLLRHLSQPTVFTSAIALSNITAVLPSGQIAPKLSITNSLGEELVLRQMNDYFSVKDVNFSYSDVAATNGVIHVIDGIL